MTWRAACSADRTTTASTVRRYRADGPVAPTKDAHPLFAFGPDTPGARSPRAEGSEPIRFYAVQGDLVGLSSGMSVQYLPQTNRSILNCARRRRSRRWRARHRRPGRRVPAQRPVGCLAAACRPRHLVCRRQGGGPRPAGRGGRAQSGAGRPRQHRQRRPALRGDKRPGADIAITAGAGSAGPDYDALGKRYLDPANRAVAGQTLTSQPGKVVHTYERELADWLRARDGFTGSDQDVLARFETLPLALRQAFLRSVYFAELRAGGRSTTRKAASGFIPARPPGHRGAVPGRRGARGRHLDVRTVRRA